MKGWVSENFVWLGRQVKLQEVLFDDANVFDMVFLKVMTELFGGAVVGLDRPDFADALC